MFRHLASFLTSIPLSVFSPSGKKKKKVLTFDSIIYAARIKENQKKSFPSQFFPSLCTHKKRHFVLDIKKHQKVSLNALPVG